MTRKFTASNDFSNNEYFTSMVFIRFLAESSMFWSFLEKINFKSNATFIPGLILVNKYE